MSGNRRYAGCKMCQQNEKLQAPLFREFKRTVTAKVQLLPRLDWELLWMQHSENDKKLSWIIMTQN